MIILILLYLIVPAVQGVLYLTTNYTFDFIETFNYIASITALNWMLSNVILASKVPFIQKIIPYDKRVKYHIAFTKAAFILVIYHAIYKFTQGYNINLAIPLGIVLTLFVIGSYLWILKVFKNYDINKKIHVIMQPVLGIMLFFHIFLSEILVEVPIISTILYLVMFTASYGLFILSKLGIFKIKCKVISINRTQDIFVINLESNKPFNYKSGQFSFLGYKNSYGKIEEHPFSFLSSGGYGKRELSFGIKILGDFTESLKEVKEGSDMWILGAFGNFRPDFDKKTPLNLIGSGIGIVPMMSLIKEIYEKRSVREINLFIAVNTREEILDIDILKKVSKELSNIQINYLIYEEDGILFSKEYFQKKMPNPEDGEFYICSSPGVRKIVVKILKDLGVKNRSIHFENFSF